MIDRAPFDAAADAHHAVVRAIEARAPKEEVEALIAQATAASIQADQGEIEAEVRGRCGYLPRSLLYARIAAAYRKAAQ